MGTAVLMQQGVPRCKRPVITHSPLVSSRRPAQSAARPPLRMNILKMILAVFAVIVAFTLLGKFSQKMDSLGAAATAAADRAKNPGLSPAGFFLLSRDDAKNPRVTIMSPPNCPSREAQLAQALAAALNSAGIPCELKQGIDFQFHDPAEVERVKIYMTHVANPLVLVRDWAKGNPTAQDVIAQYRSEM